MTTPSTSGRRRRGFRGLFAVAIVTLPAAAFAESGDDGLAQELTNPVADLVTVPIQMNLAAISVRPTMGRSSRRISSP